MLVFFNGGRHEIAQEFRIPKYITDHRRVLWDLEGYFFVSSAYSQQNCICYSQQSCICVLCVFPNCEWLHSGNLT